MAFTQHRDITTNVVTLANYTEDGKLHRVGKAAHIERDAITKVVTLEKWCQHGEFYRDNGFALIQRNAATGKVTHQAHFFEDGKKAPAPRQDRKATLRDRMLSF